MTRKQAEKLLDGPGVQSPSATNLIYRSRNGRILCCNPGAGKWVPSCHSREEFLSKFPDVPILDHIYKMLEGVEMASGDRYRIHDGVFELQWSDRWLRLPCNDLKPVSTVPVQPKERIPAKLYDQLESLGQINLSEYERGAVMDTAKREAEVQSGLSDEMRWVPVSERLPEEGTLCLIVIREHGESCTAEILGAVEKGEWFWSDDCTPIDDREVTHWMPLPPPPIAEPDEKGTVSIEDAAPLSEERSGQ